MAGTAGKLMLMGTTLSFILSLKYKKSSNSSNKNRQSLWSSFFDDQKMLPKASAGLRRNHLPLAKAGHNATQARKWPETENANK